VFNPPPLSFQPETGLAVTGYVRNVLNKPVKGTDVLLFSKSPSILKDTTTDQNGKFYFNRFPRVDTPLFVLKAVNKNGKSFNVQINVDDVKPPDFTKPVIPLWMPWYVNSDSTLLNYAKNDALIKQAENFSMGGHILKEVKITAKKIVNGSQNLNGPGNADLVLDEKDMEAAGKKTWLQLLQENVKGFNENTFMIGNSSNASTFMSWTSSTAIEGIYLSAYVTDRNVSSRWYFINRKPIKLIVDGISVTQNLTTSPREIDAAFSFITQYLKSHSAEDLKGIEIIRTAGYAATYLSRYDPRNLLMAAMNHNPPVNINPSDIAFVEITTRAGHGPVIDNSPGMYLYKPLPIVWPKQFYKPKYSIKDTVKHLPDLRSTIDWEPNVTTDANGEAQLVFYTADKPSTYTIIVEGTDMKGTLGYKIGKLNVRQHEGEN